MAVDNLYNISTSTGLQAVLAGLGTADDALQTGLSNANTALLNLQDVVLPNLINSTTPGTTDLDYDALNAFTEAFRNNEKGVNSVINTGLVAAAKGLDAYFITYEGVKLRKYLSTADTNAYNASAFVTNTAKMPVNFRTFWSRVMAEDFIFTLTKQTHASGAWADTAGWTADNLTLYGPAIIQITQTANTAANHTYTIVVTCTPASGAPVIVSDVVIGGVAAATAPVIKTVNGGKVFPPGTIAFTYSGTPIDGDAYTVQTV